MTIINKAYKWNGSINKYTAEAEDKGYKVNGLVSPIHFYYLNDSLLSSKYDTNVEGYQVKAEWSLAPMFNSTGIMSVLYVPFLDLDQLTVTRYNYDQDYYGKICADTDPNFTGKTYGTWVYKVDAAGSDTSVEANKPYLNYKIGNVDKYDRSQFGNRKTKSWRNESKLFQYPYH